jgi:hypothetical protein
MYWQSLRKTTSQIHVEREHGTDTLFAEGIRLRVDDDAKMLDLSVDLNKSLRSRSKGVNTYIDAKQLADDGLADFKGVTIDDNQVIARLGSILEHIDFEAPKVWRLHVALRRDYWFNARPGYRSQNAYESLTFHVESALSPHPRA